MKRVLKEKQYMQDSVTLDSFVEVRDPMKRVLKVTLDSFNFDIFEAVEVRDPMKRVLKVLFRLPEWQFIFNRVEVRDPMKRVLKDLAIKGNFIIVRD